MIRCIFWDNDGVLVDTEGLYFRATAETLQSVDIELTREIFIDISLTRGESVFSLAASAGFTPAEVESLRIRRNDRYAELLGKETLAIARVETTLQKLHGKLAMGVVTGSRRDHFDIIHRRTGFLQNFDFTLTREDYNHAKPHPDSYLAALRHCGLQPEECLVVEDSERGLLAARGAGLQCLVIPGEMTRMGDFSTAARILEHISEVPGIIAEFGQ
jgi:HAD superfamily hydrolase (TIGR01509 family)